jgi:O-antigen/teichoic acid export membrane protein
MNISLNVAWVPRWGMYGAAYATTLAHVLEGLLMYVYAQRVYRLPVRVRRLLLAVGAFCWLLGVSQLRLPAIVLTWGTFAVCGLSLAIMLWLGRDDLALLETLSKPVNTS